MSAHSGVLHAGRSVAFSIVWYLVPPAILGVAIAVEQIEVALLLVLGILGVLLFTRISLGAWCTVLLVSAVGMRGVVTLFGLPALINFMHYPLVLLFAIAAATRPKPDRRLHPKAPARWIAGLLVVILLSLVANMSHPMRSLIFLLIVSEPLIIIWAVSRWGLDERSRRRVMIAVIVLLAIQVPLGMGQMAAFGDPDQVKGTLTGHGAGAHVLGGLFCLGLYTTMAAMIGRKVSTTAGLAIGAVCFGMMLLANATQVLITALVAVPAMPLLVNPRVVARLTGERRTIGTLVVGGLVALALAGVAAWETSRTLPGVFDRTQDIAQPQELAEKKLFFERFGQGPTLLMVGSGPGTSGSRASLLLTPDLLKESSPLAALNLPPTQAAVSIVQTTRDPTGGSAESFASSALGILGDLGLLGVVGVLAIFVGLWRETGRGGSWLMPAARAALLMTAVLSFLDNWLEYPEFAVPLALLFGFAIQGERARQPEITRA